MLVAESNSAAETQRNSGSCITKIFIKLLRYSIDYINLCTNKLISLIYKIQGSTEKIPCSRLGWYLEFLWPRTVLASSFVFRTPKSSTSIPWFHVDVCVGTRETKRFLKHSNFHKHQRMHDVEFFGEKNFHSLFLLYENFSHTLSLGLKSVSKLFQKIVSQFSIYLIFKEKKSNFKIGSNPYLQFWIWNKKIPSPYPLNGRPP